MQHFIQLKDAYDALHSSQDDPLISINSAAKGDDAEKII